MNAGTLRHRVSIVSSSVTTPDGRGGGARTATILGTVWAAIEPISGHERQSGGALRAETTHKITIRYPSFTVTQGCRVTWQGRTFVIKSIVQRELVTAWLELRCVEGE